MKVVFQRTQRHILVNQKPLVAIGAIANKVDQVWVVQQAQHEDLNKKLPVALQSISIELLYGDNLVDALQVPLVDPAEATLPEKAVGPETVGRRRELPEGEGLRGNVAVLGPVAEDELLLGLRQRVLPRRRRRARRRRGAPRLRFIV